ncbi:DUF6182 family protein [Actinomadura fibrosa]|uniref:DUF6182 family protein n=1 Tax=Actinomadura fibrosa TaxID=111802 RepID=A0ABW2XWY8_9ACTN|nr:DUF6182 family protein [Actinomadura fibrosa]
MLDQETLRATLSDRITRARRAAPQGGTGVAAIAVLRDLAPCAFAASAVAFAARMAPRTRALWYRDFTRTIFLAGDPHNLAARFRPDHLAEDESIAWYDPAPPGDRKPLRRMLRPVQGRITWPDALDVPLTPSGRTVARLRVAVQDLTLQDYLVHVNHTLAEAVLDGLLPTDGALAIEHVPHLPDDPGPWQALRVSTDPRDPGRLRAYAALSAPP